MVLKCGYRTCKGNQSYSNKKRREEQSRQFIGTQIDQMSKMMEETERVIEQEEEKEGLVKEEIWSWGAGTEGQLGTGKLQDEHQPQLIHSLSSFTSISYLSCGGAHVIALTPGLHFYLLFSLHFSFVLCIYLPVICF